MATNTKTMKMQNLVFVVAAVFALVAGTAVAEAPGKTVDGKILNFEQGASGWKLKPSYSVMKDEGMNGTAALVYENHDPKVPYVFPCSLPTFDLMLKTGVYYRVSAMIRTEHLDPAKKHGARLCLTGVRMPTCRRRWRRSRGILRFLPGM